MTERKVFAAGLAGAFALALGGAATGGPAADLSPAQMTRAVRRSHVLVGRRLESVRQVCRLHLGGAAYPILATTERLGGILEPRLYRHVIVLRPDLTKAQVLDFDHGVEPTRCDDDHIYFAGGTVTVDQQQGSVVQFANGAADAWIATDQR